LLGLYCKSVHQEKSPRDQTSRVRAQLESKHGWKIERGNL
jgi:hypothetical protein